jgi:SM-20-related protein
MTRLRDIALVVRSKNTSPFTYALDIMFREASDYEHFKSQQLVDAALIGRLYAIPRDQVLDVIYFDPAMAIKICLVREIPSGAPGDRDVYGAQQHAPLLEWEFAAGNDGAADTQLFATIAAGLRAEGYSIVPGALAPTLADNLLQQLRALPQAQFTAAGVGREQGQAHNPGVRRDKTCWISGGSAAERQWLEWAGKLQLFLNRELLLGLFSFESHFAHYGEGDFYRRHRDAFRGESNRVLSLVAYLNQDWQPADGGELVIYPEGAPDGIRVPPAFGTVAVFLSEEFEHEVLPAQRDRYSIAGWFRVNSSSGRRADPPA